MGVVVMSKMERSNSDIFVKWVFDPKNKDKVLRTSAIPANSPDAPRAVATAVRFALMAANQDAEFPSVEETRKILDQPLLGADNDGQ